MRRMTCHGPTIKLPPVEQWERHGACRGMDTEMFYPPRGESGADARAVCARCPVRARCQRRAVANKYEFGIWGGTDPDERRELRERRAALMASFDPAIADVLPAAEKLVDAVHDMSRPGIAAALSEVSDRHAALCVVLAALIPPDTDLVPQLAWLQNAEERPRSADPRSAA